MYNYPQHTPNKCHVTHTALLGRHCHTYITADNNGTVSVVKEKEEQEEKRRRKQPSERRQKRGRHSQHQKVMIKLSPCLQLISVGLSQHSSLLEPVYWSPF